MATNNQIAVTTGLLTRMVAYYLGRQLYVTRNMSKGYSDEFGNRGRQVGDKITVPKPVRVKGGTGLAWHGESVKDQTVDIVLNNVDGVHVSADALERTLRLQDFDMAKKVAKAASIALSTTINARSAQFICENTWNSVGTPGAVPSSIDTYLAAGDKLVQGGLPPNEQLDCIINRRMSSKFVSINATVHNPASKIGQMFNSGEAADDSLGYRWWQDQTIYARTVGALGGSPLINGANQTGDGGNNGTMSLITDGWTNAAAPRMKKSDRFTIAGVYSVHPHTRQSTGDLQQFVVLADVSSDVNGNLTALIAPAITPVSSGDQYANVDSVPADNAALTMIGAASTVSTQGILMAENAFGFVSVPFQDPSDGEGVSVSTATDPNSGVVVSLMKGVDIRTREQLVRWDCLSGNFKLFPEMACMIESQ